MRATASLIGIALLAACSSATDDWRPLTADETAALDRQSLVQNLWLAAPPRREAVADFDGDGRQDRAVFRVTKEAYAVFVIGGDGRARRISEPRPAGELANLELGVLTPGAYPTFCGRNEPNKAGCRPSVILSPLGVLVTTFEAGQVVYFWNGSAFDAEALTD